MSATAATAGKPSIPVPMLATLALLSAIAPLAIDMYLPGLPALGDDLHTSPAAAQLTLTTFMLGLAAGQLLMGPLSDSLGRRRPLILGTALLIVAGIGCALAPSIGVLIAFRFMQGLTGGIGVVVARAVIADRTSGDRSAKLFSIMMIITSAAPVVAPLLGGALIGPIGWRGIFYVLTGLALVMLLAVLTCVPETLPVERRHPFEAGSIAHNMGVVLRNRRYLGYTLTFSIGFGAMFAYISASPFVIQDLMGFSPGVFSILFAVNAIGIGIAGTVNTRLVGRVRPQRLLAVGVGMFVTVGIAMMLTTVFAPGVHWLLLVLMFCLTSSFGLTAGNATALALGEVRDNAGSGSAVLGTLQFVVGAIVPPLAGLGGSTSAVPMATVVLVCTLLSAGAFLTTRR
ncbi:multidrug effflux MFS transporter [Gordonia hydrophobica]|uniref:Multidrug effflux MFS transporter n=1 Tax=Gordonia hydrophobica TaxID=40516 RepID=A0ABZ2TWJ7_9ACTN|nr:multidrug effflux MFS transporter [Gordonia hydrophobica]MBM7366079.1 DHA1 family bicyclomycin/chloramphenicol resistance-like MFS transporter [Gordonia hydrophobica]